MGMQVLDSIVGNALITAPEEPSRLLTYVMSQKIPT
jgi:hypothetical protein